MLHRLALSLILLAAPLLTAADEKPVSRVVFASCLHQDKPAPIWKPLLAEKPELFLFIGDTIYADTQDIAKMRGIYDRLAAQDDWKALLKTCPVHGIWDDHDYGGNDVGAEYPKKKESQEAFHDFFGIAKDSPRRKQEGVYHSFISGPEGKRLQVILLDSRYHRSQLKVDAKRPRNLGQYVANTDEGTTILGEKQWAWLEEQLKKPAEIRLIASSVQVIAEEHGFEKWMNFPKERGRLFQLIRDTKAKGVVFLSGDRHLAELSLMDGEVGYPLFDITSSGLNQANKRFRKLEPNKHRVGIMDVGNNYGVIRIDWTKADPTIAMEIRDEEGEITIRQKIPVSRLAPGKKSTAVTGLDLAAEAKKKIGEEWTVEMSVLATGANRTKTMVFLNSEKDFKSEQNFTVVLDLKALAEELKKAEIDDPAKHYVGKKVKVTGTVSEFNGRVQIQVKKLSQITLAK